ncbi:hypothetical protein EU546_03915 [Candidatus Thorarchaeota archaeon]|nr:MAG: hypothetical protein EU546_03915 [Candidatus Thorarchaeota archaeon]
MEDTKKMDSRMLRKRAVAILLLATLFAPFFVGPVPVRAQESLKIVFDYSHGQFDDKLYETTDLNLERNLTALGYEVVWAKGGINSSVLSGAVAFIAGSIYGEDQGYLASEITAIENWFNSGKKFLWIGYDSDYGGVKYVNNNMTAILEAVGSHVYGEPTSVEDPYSNCDASYRVVANQTSTDPFVAPIVSGITDVLMHGPTCVYGSNSDTPGEGVSPVDLRDTSIANVTPFLFYGESATIVDADVTYPYAHTDGATGGFVAASIEVGAGDKGTGVIVVSGASPYGDYQPMCSWVYKEVPLTGLVVKQAIDFGIQQNYPRADFTLLLVAGAIGAIIVIVLVIFYMRRK